MRYLVFIIPIIIFGCFSDDTENEFCKTENQYHFKIIDEVNYSTINYDELEMEVPKHLKYVSIDTADYNDFQDTTLDFYLIRYQNIDTLFEGNERSFYRTAKYPDSMYHFVDVSNTPKLSATLLERIDTIFISKVIDKICKMIKIEQPSVTILDSSYNRFANFIVINIETFSNIGYLKSRIYYRNDKVYRVRYILGKHKGNFDYKKYKKEADLVLNSVRFIKE